METPQTSWVVRPWGKFLTVTTAPGMWVKTLAINPRSRLSLQSHERRVELWHAPRKGLVATIGNEHLKLEDGMVYTVPVGSVHRLYNPTRRELLVVEVAFGLPDENDITRFEDDYGREGESN